MIECNNDAKCCPRCNIYTKQQYCPLCEYKLLDGSEDRTYYPVYETKPQRRDIIQRIVLLIVITVISISLLINLLTELQPLWFLYVLGPALYGLLLINHTILSKTHIGSKVVFQVIVLSNMFFILDIATGNLKWSIHYVIPFLIIAATLLITAIALQEPMKWEEYIGYLTIMIVLGFLPIALFISEWSVMLWPSAVTALYAFLTLMGMLLFSEKMMKNEIIRRFHF